VISVVWRISHQSGTGRELCQIFCTTDGRECRILIEETLQCDRVRGLAALDQRANGVEDPAVQGVAEVGCLDDRFDALERAVIE